MIMHKGKTIYLSSVTVDVESARKIVELRNGDVQKKFLNPTKNSIEDQLEWLGNYLERNMNGDEFYFFIKRIDTDEIIGTVRIYDIKRDIDSFCWGSWILNERKTHTAALESYLLINKFAFYHLNYQNSHFDVRKDNSKVISFHKKTGAVITDDDEMNYYFQYTKEKFEKFSLKYNGLIK
ncbi:TPA: GNAT family N-acetyltransferase [Escherichia coli]|nr:GNAT family N-acetyltransferase [Escherichia coli]